MPPVFEMIPVQLLGVRGLATRQVRLLLYTSERSNTRATHIQCCPREPRESFADHQKSPANRVRSATASGSAAQSDAAARRGCQFGKRTATSFFSKILGSRPHSGFIFHYAGVVREVGDRIFARRPHWRRTGNVFFHSNGRTGFVVSLLRRGPFSMLLGALYDPVIWRMALWNFIPRT